MITPLGHLLPRATQTHDFGNHLSLSNCFFTLYQMHELNSQIQIPFFLLFSVEQGINERKTEKCCVRDQRYRTADSDMCDHKNTQR